MLKDSDRLGGSKESNLSNITNAGSVPTISLPKGGGAIRGIGEKFGANPVNGTASITLPIPVSPARSGFGPQLSISYDSGAGNGCFGFGWNLSLPAITRKTDKGLPRYLDEEESDVFILSSAEDLVPVPVQAGAQGQCEEGLLKTLNGIDYCVRAYRPRIEGLFARIERWVNRETGDTHWRSISRDNIITLYGKDNNSRIFDPNEDGLEHPKRIFTWLICESYDDKGNAIIYEYKEENSDGVDQSQAQEKNRSVSANRYPKWVKYGNRISRLIKPELSSDDWMFQVVFDYGEHDVDNPKPDGTADWLRRQDPFSTYRASFEIRTYRLCQRVLMFHHFPEENGVGQDCLVRSTNFTYQDHPIMSFMASCTQSGYKRKPIGYLKESLPPLEFEYSKPIIQGEIRSLDAESLQNLPYGLDGTDYQWLDLDGEGVSGILSEQAESWFYKRNISPITVQNDNGRETLIARFAPVEIVTPQPLATDINGRQQFFDLAGDGKIDLVQLNNPLSGYYERTDKGRWSRFVPFESVPNVDWDDPNLRFIDLTGDGHTDIIISEDNVFTWYPSLAESGFGSAQRTQQFFDEEEGPRLVFADSAQSIYLADLSGDGLTDLLRIRNGEVCYWPNLGYGRFGAKVTMDNAPWFDHPELFDQKRIRLADIDGSGVTDIIYLKHDGVDIYFNQSGNSWATARTLTSFPQIDNLSSVVAVDLLGNGTACLVWSSSTPGHARTPMYYLDLMGGQKPHLMIGVKNNMGVETRVRYAASTKFYLEDKLAGNPWITKLPFPVHVVERVEMVDLISRNRFVTSYAYHHGYFDGIEREFRGFGLVEQHDTEAFEDYVAGVESIGGDQERVPELFQPPVTTRTWFHTGAFFHGDRILHQLRDGYYLKQQHIPDPILPTGLDEREFRECLRALKGLPLRQEIYSFDGSAQEQNPYSVIENNYDVKLLQPRREQKHAVFFTYGCESVSHFYERNPADPRIAHSLNLEIDPFGNILKSASVAYGRKRTDSSLPVEVRGDQQKLYITYDEFDYTNDIDRENPTPAYRLRVPHETRSYEITGTAPDSGLFKLEEIKRKIAGAADIEYEVVASGLAPQKRMLSKRRMLFLDDHLKPLPLGQLDTLALEHEGYQLAFTPGVTGAHYAGKITDDDFNAAGYVHFNGDANWWIPSGTAIYAADAADHFFIPIGTKDPLGMERIATFDQYDLLVERIQVKQAVWSVVTFTNDYRVLGPVMMTDPNKNRSAVEIDALGMVVKSAVLGKAGAGEGDTLDDPTVRMEYELFNWMNHRKPNFVHTFAREQHGAANPRWQESFSYSNGSGSVAMVKAQAHPGKALRVNPDGTATEVEADPRWIGNGRTILNNKGNPVKQYEPYFSTTHEYEDEKALREIGVTPIFYYDAVGRNIRTEFPNGTLARVEFDPWMQEMFDVNDTVKESQWYRDRGSPDPTTQPEPLNDPERRAAWLAAKHADTPGTIHFDSLGRPVYAVSDYGGGKTAAVRSESDLTGRFSKLFDQQQREVASGFMSMAGAPILGESAERGSRRIFQNVLGALVKTWDEHEREFRAEYDELHRPVSTFAKEAGKDEILFSYVVYGDRHPGAEQLNLLGIAHQTFDQAGMIRVPEFDFKGNPKSVERTLAKDYKDNLNWNALASQPNYAAIQTAANPALETDEVFTASSLYDALNRPTRITLPDRTVIVPTYNEANLLASLRAQIRGQGALRDFLKDQDYDAKGQRQFAHYGNGLFTRYFYDPKTFRLINLLTHKSGDDPNANGLQNLHYVYDPVGNITQIRDDAQQTHYFNNAVVRPEFLYEYDAIYQLLRASGREHAGSANDSILTNSGLDFVPQLPHPNDAAAVRTYTEEYEYDLLGNIKALRHRFKTQAGAGNGWTRHYRYAYEEDPTNRTNRLTATSLPGDPDAGPYTATYQYDDYGNMKMMPHLSDLKWNFMDQFRQVDLGGGGTAYYVYGAGGQRIRKVIERQGGKRTERIYLGAVEIYRERQGNDSPHLERQTLHISDNAGRIAQVDTKIRDDNNSDPANALNTPLIRYQYGNHLGSATLETDDIGEVISYEEYHPYGTSAYRSAKPGFDLSLKRYRFSGKERDDETGLYYFGARYYAAWLGRWTSSDPVGFADGFNLSRYCGNNPVHFVDHGGFKKNDNETVQGQVQGGLGEEEAINQFNSLYAQERGKVVTDLEPVGNGNWRIVAEHPLTDEDLTGVTHDSGDNIASDEGSVAPTTEESPSPSAEPSQPPPDAPESEAPSVGAAATSQAAPAAERVIWNYEFANEGFSGSQRGFILQNLYTNNPNIMQRDNKADFDYEPPGENKVQQIKSTDSTKTKYLGQLTRDATRDAGNAITNDPRMAGKNPQAVIITPTDAPASVGNDVNNALGRARKFIPNNSLPPEHVRGLPGIAGAVGRFLTVGGYVFSAFALGGDIARGDVPMGIGDALGTIGGGLELYAIGAPGAPVAGVSAMTAGLVIGGLGIAVGSAVSGYRALKAGDTAGAIAGGVGLAAGLAIAAGQAAIATGVAVAAAPVVLALGIGAALGVGIFHLGRHFSWW